MTEEQANPNTVDNLKFSNERSVALFLVEAPYNGYPNIAQKVTTCIGIFNSKEEAEAFISNNHSEGNKYFLTEGFYLG